MSNKRNKMFNLEFFQVFSDTVFQPGHSSYGLEMDMAMCSFWAHPWALSRLLGPVTSLGSSLNDRHSPWASVQLGKASGLAGVSWKRLGKAGQGWARPLDVNRPELAGTAHWHTPLLANPWKCCFWTFWALHIFFLAHLAVLAVLAISGPTLATKMSQGLLRLCCSIETRDRIERITLTAVLFD